MFVVQQQEKGSQRGNMLNFAIDNKAQEDRGGQEDRGHNARFGAITCEFIAFPAAILGVRTPIIAK